jgi:hypothetical protein
VSGNHQKESVEGELIFIPPVLQLQPGGGMGKLIPAVTDVVASQRLCKKEVVHRAEGHNGKYFSPNFTISYLSFAAAI